MKIIQWIATDSTDIAVCEEGDEIFFLDGCYIEEFNQIIEEKDDKGEKSGAPTFELPIGTEIEFPSEWLFCLPKKELKKIKI